MKVQMSRWKGMDEDISDDQQDIARGRGMVDAKFQGGFGLGGTQVRAPIARVRQRETFNRRRDRNHRVPVFFPRGSDGREPKDRLLADARRHPRLTFTSPYSTPPYPF